MFMVIDSSADRNKLSLWNAFQISILRAQGQVFLLTDWCHRLSYSIWMGLWDAVLRVRGTMNARSLSQHLLFALLFHT